jgi:hypothetical protein
MYCSSCGSVVPNNLTFCNKCGTKITTNSLTGPNPDSLVWAICALFIMGTGVIIGLMAVMKEVVKLNEGVILAVMMICFSMMLILEGILSWLLIGSWRSGRNPGSVRHLEERKTNELNEAPARMLAEPLISVTEHTTRAFDPVYTERK